MPITVAVLFSIVLLGGGDSWEHYVGGGSYLALSPSMSPDGSKIVFSSPRSGRGDIYQIDRDGSNPVRLTDNPAFETSPVHCPDGSKIAFVRQTGKQHLWIMDQDGSNQRQL